METKQESSSSRMSGPAKIFASLPDELKHVLTILVFYSACLELWHAIQSRLTEEYVLSGIWWVIGLSLLYTVIKYVFSIFSGKKVSVLAVSALAVLLAFLFRSRELSDTAGDTGFVMSAGMVAAFTYVLWMFLQLTSETLYPGLILCIISDAVMVCVFMGGTGVTGGTVTRKIIFTALFVLSACHIRNIMGYRDKNRYPFIYFLALFIFILFIPVREDPINWKPVVDAANKMVDKTKEMARSVSYYFSDLRAGSSYRTGYSAFAQTGNSIIQSDLTELKLRTIDNTTYKYVDEESGKEMIRRRTIYLAGGRTTDHDQLLDILFALYTHDIDAVEASLFMRRSKIDISYEYLKTKDEILPVCTLNAVDDTGKRLSDSEGKEHRKGYSYSVEFLDFDYGNQNLVQIMENPVTTSAKKDISYKMMSLYSYNTFGINLNDILDGEEYEKWQKKDGVSGEYLDTSGATERMRELALNITSCCADDFEKCRAIESYLRQYTYKTDTGSGGGGSTESAKGLSSLADSFLFETGSGYCVHYTAAMIMLLRLNGIPARFTAGYRYVFPFDKQDVYEVNARFAHAWPEACIEGFGWVGFEPTSAFSTAEERSWNRQQDAGPARSGDSYKASPGLVPYPAPAVTATETTDDKARSSDEDLKETVRIVLIIVSGVILTVLILILGAFLFRVIRYRRADTGRRLIMDVNDITALIRSRSAMPLEDRGVMSDYEPYLPDKYREELLEVFDIYYRIRYGSDGKAENVTLQEGERVRSLRNTLYGEYRRFPKRAGKKPVDALTDPA